MATHQTFTNNQIYATLLGPMVRGGQPISGEPNWAGSVSVWSGDVISVTPTKIVVRLMLPGLPSGVTGIDAEVYGTTTVGTGSTSDWNGMNVTHIDWSPIGSGEILARWTFDAPTYFGRDSSVAPVGLHWFLDIFAFGANRLAWWDALFAAGDTLIGAGANDILRGGGGNDEITGGGGADALQGDDGNDTFIYRAGDAQNGEAISGGDGTDRILSMGTAATANLLQAGAVYVNNVNIEGLEELWTNGTEVVTSATQFVFGGFSNIVGKTGAIDVLTIINAADWDFSTLTFTNWDAQQDLIGIIGDASSSTMIGTNFNDVIVGDLGVDDMSGGQGDDRFVILSNDTNPFDTVNGQVGRDTLQVTAPTAPGTFTSIRGMNLVSIEELEIVEGIVSVDASDLNGSSIAGPGGSVLTTGKIDTLIGTANGGTLNVFIDNNLEGILFQNTTFENWDQTALRIIAGTGTTAVLGPTNVGSTIIGQFAAQGMVIVGGLDADTISGTAYADSIYTDGFVETDIGYGMDYANGGGGDDLIAGSDVRDSLEGDAGNDILGGGGGDDTLDGGDGNDRIFGDLGNDGMTGGADNDWFVYNSGEDIIFDFVAGGSEDFVDLRLFTSITSLSALLNVGTQFGPHAYFDFGGGKNLTIQNVTLGSLTASDFLFAAPSGFNVINGTAGNDTLNGTAGADQINALAGDDVLFGGAGNDELLGDGGIDYLFSGTGSNTLSGGAGLDIMVSEGTADIMNGGADQNYYYRQAAGSSQITGGTGVDILVGGDLIASNDVFQGGGGDDYALGGAGNDELIGGIGNDILLGQDGSDILDGGLGTNYLYADGVGGSDMVRVNASLGGAQTHLMSFFEGGGTNDVLQISGSTLTSYAQFQTLAGNLGVVHNGNLLQNTGTGALLTLGLGTANQTDIWFLGTLAGALTSADFAFV